MFGDMFMVGLGVASVEDIATSVLTTVIGHQSATGRLVVDAGWARTVEGPEHRRVRRR